MTIRNTVPKSNGANLASIVNVLLNTKLNYLKQQEAFVFRAYEDVQNINPVDFDPVSQQSSLRTIKKRLDEFIGRLEQLAQARKLLKLIRTFLNESTALTIYELLANDEYLNYTEQYLRRLLGVHGQFQIAGRFASN